VQPNERNVFDQRWLEYELLEKYIRHLLHDHQTNLTARYDIHITRQTLAELAISASLDPSTHALMITIPSASSLTNHPTTYEISTIYFRASYTPSDFPAPSYYDTRFLLERSRAIKCPSLPLQLAGGKKVQEALTRPGILEHFLGNESVIWGADAIDLTAYATDIRGTWMGMWALDSEDADIAAALDNLQSDSSTSGQEGEPPGTSLARIKAQSLVLKPQREGGGNNVYREAIPAFLDSLREEEREAWIAMEMIETPRKVGGYLVRAAPSSASDERAEKKVVRADVISELGIFGYALFGAEDVVEREVGWLVRTKGTDSNEGGVAAGFSVLDSVVLV
jgi:glutathione synthase